MNGVKMGFEQADAALNTKIEQAGDALKQDDNVTGVETKTDSTPDSNNQAAKAVFELDKAEKFMFEGKEWTLEKLKQAIMRQEDYTKKTQALSQENKFAESLSYDLEAVAENPELAEEFKKVYPQKYHSALNKVLALVNKHNEQAASAGEAPNLDQNAIQKLIEKAVNSKVGPIISDYTQRETAAIEAKLESLAAKYSKEYDLADEDRVLAKAERLHNQGTKLTDQVWEKLWKEDHENGKSKFDAYSKKQFEQQKAANAKNKDIAKGGGVPGSAPKRETFKEATERAVRELGGR